MSFHVSLHVGDAQEHIVFPCTQQIHVAGCRLVGSGHEVHSRMRASSRHDQCILCDVSWLDHSWTNLQTAPV